MHRRLRYSVLLLTFLLNTDRGKSEELKITISQVSPDTVRISVSFPDPVFLSSAEGKTGSGTSNSVFVIRSTASIYLECAADRFEIREVRRETNTVSSTPNVILADDIATDETGILKPLMPSKRTPVIEKTDLGLSEGKYLFLVRFNPYAESQDGKSFKWIERLSICCAGREIRPIEKSSVKTNRILSIRQPREASKSAGNDFTLDGPALKIWVKKEGLVVIPQTMIVQAGWDISTVDPRKLRMVGLQGEIPIRVIGQEDGTFDFTDAVEFYGEPFWNTDRPGEKRLDLYSEKNVYWLTIGTKPGMRLADESSSTLNDQENESFPRSFTYDQHEEKNWAFSRFPNADFQQMDDAEYYTYTAGPVGGQSAELFFQLDNPDLFSTRLIDFRLKFRGQTSGSAAQSVDQPTDVLLNNRLIMTYNWSEAGEYVIENHEFSPAFLWIGQNKLTVINRSSDGELSRIFVDWFEIGYSKYYRATRNFLRFRPPDHSSGRTIAFKIEGFEQSDIDIYKIGSSRMIGQKVSSVIDSLGIINYTVTFQDLITDESAEYLAVTSSSKILPDSVNFVQNIGLHAQSRGADYIVIVPSDSLGFEPLKPLIDQRQEQNLRVEIVLLDSIYNEFNFGIPGPKAIRSFLAYAKSHWRPSPRFLLLIGDCDLTRASSKKGNTIPSPFYQTLKYGAAVSDFSYTLLDTDDYPDLAVGRLPVQTRAELENLVEKMIEYENSAVDQWKNRYLMIGAGTPTDVFGIQTKTLIEDLLPRRLHAERMFLSGDPADPEIGGTQQLMEYFDRGVGWINFRGHGGGAIWADAGLLDLDDARLLKNKGKYPFITSMTCFTGDFSGERPSLGEILLTQKQGGAIAFVGSTSVGWVATDYTLLKSMVETYNSEPLLSIGEIIQKAKIRFAIENNTDLTLSELHQYNLIGDPALKLTFPTIETTVHLNKRSYSSLDSIQISGENTEGNSRILFEIVDAHNRVRASKEMDVPSDSWDAVLPIPPGFREKKAGLRVYAWNKATGNHSHKFLPFAVGESFFDSVATSPRSPTSRDVFRIQARFEDRAAIRSVFCNVFQPSPVMLTLVQDPQGAKGVYTSTSSIGPFSPGTRVLYQVTVESEAGISKSDSVSFSIPTLPDLAVNSLQLGGIDHVFLQTDVHNLGQESAKSVRVRFEAPGWGWSAEDTVNIAGNARVVAGVPLDTKTGKILFRVIVNSDSSPVESDSLNNRYTKELSINAFNVTPDRGSSNGSSAPDTVSVFYKGAIPTVSCLVPPRAVRDRSVLTIQSEVRIDETAPDPEKESQVVHRFLLSKLADGEEALKDISLIFTTRSAGEASALRPYHWNPPLNNWISVPYQLKDTVFSVFTRSFGLYSLMRNNDHCPPSVEIQMENQTFSDGCYVPDHPVFSIHLQDSSGIDFRPDKIQIILDDGVQRNQDISLPDSVHNPAQIVISYRPTLAKGSHTLSIRCSDIHGNTTQTETFGFQVSDRFDVQFLGNHPNPFKRETVFVYLLTENADQFSIKLYTVAGKRIRVFEDGDLTAADYHEVEWDGKDDWGDEVANGVYFFRLTTIKGDERREITGKIARVR